MKWVDLEAGDVVANHDTHETCLLVKKSEGTFTWFVLDGCSHEGWGSNPYTIEQSDQTFEVDGWIVYRGSEELSS